MENQATPPPATPAPVTTAPAAPVAAPSADLIDIADFAKVQLRVAAIETVEKVEKSKKLYKIQVDLGPELGKRQIVSGIATYYTPEQLIGRRIIVVANLKPAQLMGVESQGMLLAASSADRSVLTLLTPAENVPLGASVS